MSKQNKLITKQQRNGEVLLMIIVSLAGLAAFALYLSELNGLGNLMLLRKVSIIFLLCTIFVITGCVVYWCYANYANKGIRYAWRHYRITTSVEAALLGANIYNISLGIFNRNKVANVPKVKLSFSSDLITGKLKIKNNPEYDKKLESLRLSSALDNYVVEDRLLSGDHNWYEFKLINTKVNRQLEFSNYERFFAESHNNWAEPLLFLDKFRRFLPISSALIVGQTGSGKTYALETFALQMLTKPHPYDLYFADPKISEISVLGNLINPKQMAQTPEGIVNLLDTFVVELNRRQKIMHEKLQSNLGSTYDSCGLVPAVFIFDEYAAFQAELSLYDKKTRDRATAAVTQIVLKGRQLGCFIWVAMQKSDATTIKTQIRDNLPLKIVLGNAEPETYVTTFGASADIPRQDFNLGEGVFTCPIRGIATRPRVCAIPKLDFNPIAVIKNSKRGLCNNPRSIR